MRKYLETGTQTNYIGLIHVLLEGIKELKKEIDDLKITAQKPFAQ